MKLLFVFFRMRLIDSLQYRAVAISEIATRLIWGLMEVLAFAAVYRGADDALPLAFSQTATYMMLQQGLYVLFAVVFAESGVLAAISGGDIAYALSRPSDLYGRWFCEGLAARWAHTCVCGLPAVLIALILPSPFRAALPPDAITLLFFLISALLGSLLTMALAMLMYVSLFYTLSHRGVKIIVTALTTFLSGGVIPLSFFPAHLRTAASLMPFAGMRDTPISIYCQIIAGGEIARALTLQGVWLILLIALGRALMRRALTRVIAQGG